ncbi:MAG TPA: hypothetical protein VKT82_07180 [Ktedonobacterales bacterium]|nr:hypothetical protein [Ktedonobacterales bacterium]
MSRAATSIFAYGCYLLVLALTLFTIPDVVANLFGLPAHKDVWLYVTAMTVLSLGGYYIAASRDEATNFFRFSVIMRCAVPFFFGAFALLGLTKVNILLFTPPDIVFATWTLLALRARPATKAIPAQA